MSDAIKNIPDDLEEDKASNLVKILFGSLKKEGVKCCVWKGSYDIEDILFCNDDIDLLISRPDSKKVLSILQGLGFKRAIASESRKQQGIDEYYAFDEVLEKYVHVQLYHQLILGERLIENYHLPIEKTMLSNIAEIDGVPIANPSMELIVFVIRKYIQKNVLYLLRPGAGKKISKDIHKEFEYLLKRTDIGSIEKHLDLCLPGVDKILFRRCITNMNDGISISKWIYLRYCLSLSLKAFKRRPPILAFFSWLYRRSCTFKENVLSSSESRKTPAMGGFSVAIIGSDGSGKSTAINYLSQWLGHVYKVKYFHMGRPKPSLLTSMLSRSGRILLPIACKNYKTGEAGVLVSSKWPVILQWLPKLLLFSIARDRYRLFTKIQRACNRGVIALIDRYPVKEIKQMDCARIHTLSGYNKASPGILSRLEKSYYEKIVAPDITLLLVVDPEVAAARQPGDGYEYVIRRATEIKEISATLSKSIDVVDSSTTLDEVEKQLRCVLWRVV